MAIVGCEASSQEFSERTESFDGSQLAIRSSVVVGSGAGGKAARDRGWTCPSCTYQNTDTKTLCEMWVFCLGCFWLACSVLIMLSAHHHTPSLCCAQMSVSSTAVQRVISETFVITTSLFCFCAETLSSPECFALTH